MKFDPEYVTTVLNENFEDAKTLFLATVSHEVRTPLAAIVGATDLLMATDLAPEPARYAQILQRSSERLRRALPVSVMRPSQSSSAYVLIFSESIRRKRPSCARLIPSGRRSLIR